MILRPEAGAGTRAVWAGEENLFSHGATVVPVYQSVLYAHDTVEAWHDAIRQEPRDVYTYARTSSPTCDALERKLAQLDGAERSLSFATGMAAVSSVLLALLKPGDRLVSIKDTYGGTNLVFRDYLPKFGIDVELVDTDDEQSLRAAVKRGCRLLYLESPTNPTLKILDLESCARMAHDVGALVVVDNTVATPINQLPLRNGCDIVLHSATKFLSGHSDVLAGTVSGSSELLRPIARFRGILGTVLSAQSASLVLRSLMTLELRVRRHNENAQAVAEFLAGHRLVEKVFYPGLPSHRGHAVARRQMAGFGGMLSFLPRGGLAASRTLLNTLQLAHLGSSLGSVATLAGLPETTSHAELSPEEFRATGIAANLVRYSAGVENAADLIDDLAQALTAIDS
ncbi:MAG: aminotransferase class I/II-fold pyridoxal phosphate-dependent enzyme [Steroidobacteraceae bacterium]